MKRPSTGFRPGMVEQRDYVPKPGLRRLSVCPNAGSELYRVKHWRCIRVDTRNCGLFVTPANLLTNIAFNAYNTVPGVNSFRVSNGLEL